MDMKQKRHAERDARNQVHSIFPPKCAHELLAVSYRCFVAVLQHHTGRHARLRACVLLPSVLKAFVPGSQPHRV